MAKFFVRWHVENSMLAMPAAPEKDFETVLIDAKNGKKEDLHNGSMADWGQFGNGTDGYVLSDLDDAAALATVMNKYRPYITWDIHPVLGVDESMVIINEGTVTVRFH